MNVALVGHPLSGKSTLFSALTGIGSAADYGKTAKVGTVKVPDVRAEWLAELYKPKKITHAGLDFTDLPGLSFASAGEQAQSVKLIGDIRQADMIVLVLRAFDNPVVPAYRDRIDPVADLAELRSEFILCDMEQVSNRIEKLKVQNCVIDGKGMGSGTRHRADVIGISELGMEIDIAEPPDLDGEIDLTMICENGKKLRKRANVVWFLKKIHPETGTFVGLKFI